MEQSVASQFKTPVGALDAHLDSLEQLLEDPTPDRVEQILVTLDAAATEFEILEKSNVDIGDERVRWEDIVENVKHRPQLISVPARGVPGGMNALRAKHAPATNFWWQADRMRSMQLRNQLIRAFVLLLLAAAVMWGAGWVWGTYFAPPDTEPPAALQQLWMHATAARAALVG